MGRTRAVILSILIVMGLYMKAHAQDFPLPRPPQDMTGIPQRAAYIASRYWDSADLEALAKAHAGTHEGISVLEQAFVNYLSVFPLAESDSLCRNCATELMLKADGAGPDAARVFLALAEKYLFQADSPMLQEEYFLGFVQAAQQCRNITEEQLSRIPFWTMAIENNRKGSAIEPFRFETREGSLASFSDIPGRKLLILFDTECSECRRLIEKVKGLNPECAVVAVAVNCTRERFLSFSAEIPEGWTAGWDSTETVNGGAFMIRHLPDIFLISEDGTVLSKHRLDDILQLIQA